MGKLQSAERVSHIDESDNFVFQRSLLAYHEAATMVSGDVLEIGTGSGYGISVISPVCRSFITIDKFDTPADLAGHPNAEFRRCKVPPLSGFEPNSFDFVVSFQVIEHIADDLLLLSEIERVLRPGGKLVISTPNRKMSLTRNPWHIREYTADEFRNLLRCSFTEVNAYGVFGRENVMRYYARNKESVGKIARLDILDLQHRLPRWMLRIPYDIMNRINRRKLLERNRELTAGIKMIDYYISPVTDDAFDLFFVAAKAPR